MIEFKNEEEKRQWQLDRLFRIKSAIVRSAKRIVTDDDGMMEKSAAVILRMIDQAQKFDWLIKEIEKEESP